VIATSDCQPIVLTAEERRLVLETLLTADGPEKPRELAEDLLAPRGWTRADIDRAIDTGVTRRVGLDKTLPLFVVYRTASADEEGRAVFRPDPYGWDVKLLNALAAAERRRPAGVLRLCPDPPGAAP
jgi:hypothetical protein